MLLPQPTGLEPSNSPRLLTIRLDPDSPALGTLQGQPRICLWDILHPAFPAVSDATLPTSEPASVLGLLQDLLTAFLFLGSPSPIHSMCGCWVPSLNGIFSKTPSGFPYYLHDCLKLGH